MVVPSVWVQSRVPSFKEKTLVVIDFKTDNLDVFKVHVVAGMVDMACNFRVLNLPLPFCAPQFWSLMVLLSGHSIQNYTVSN